MCVFEFQNHGAVVDRKTMAIMTPKPDVLIFGNSKLESKVNNRRQMQRNTLNFLN